ncbi:MAG: hypothetical protein FRX49_07936 [Trebouxia sp. A1-2]|nr:MAG: hypothetical protein FRX49_07936 [Trebouxia sp. A1-2]
MTRVKLFLVIDVAEFGGSLTASQHALLSARVLAACHWSAFNLTWAYKLVNTSVAPRVFEAALHDACTSSLTGNVPLPFTPEEHVRCNCTMFEGLRRWLHEISQDTFRILLQRHLLKKGKDEVITKSAMKDMQIGNQLRHKSCRKAAKWIDARVTRQFDDKETIEVQHNDGTVKNFRLAEVQQMQNKGNLQWVSPAEAVKQSLDGMLRRCFCDGSMINAEQLLHSTQQHEVDAALSPLLGLQQPASMQEAFPPAACDMHELVQQLDLRIAPDDAAKFKQLAEEARKLKQAKKQARKLRRKAPAHKPIDEAAARLAAHRAKVSKQERELQRAKAEQQKAELAAKHKMIQKERAANADVKQSSCDPDEVMSERRAEPLEDRPVVGEDVEVDPSISANRTISNAVTARDTCLQRGAPAEHQEALACIAQAAEDLVSTAAAALLRESAVCATETAPSYRPCPSPSASRLAASPSARAHGSDPAASMSVVRQALEKALLQDNENFWAANPPDPNAMDQQDPFRRNKLAMQFFLRLHILVACKGDISVERLANPPVIIPTGAFWEGLEEYWSDLVNELPDIPSGGNHYFMKTLKPRLGVKVPNAIQMLGRNCGLYTEDDLLLSPEGDGGVVVGDSSCPDPSGSRKPASRASSLQPSVSRGSGGLAEPALSDASSGHASGSTLPQARADQQAVKPKLGSLMSKPPTRKRDLTQRLANGKQFKWNPKAAMAPKHKSAMAGKKKLHSKKTETPPPHRIRAADLGASPTSTEESDAIPGTDRKAQQEATSAQPRASKRHLAFCPIPTIQELEEAEEADSVPAEFGDDAAPQEAHEDEEENRPAMKGWLQNASRKVNLGRLASRQLSRGVSSLLPPQPTLHTSQSTRLDQLLSTLSPAKALPAKMPSPVRPKATYGEAIPPPDSGLRSPHRFSPGPSRMSPHHARLPSSMASPDRPKRVQRSLMSPTHSKAIRNVLSPKRAKPTAVLHEPARQVHADGTGHMHKQQALAAVANWGPRPGSATFSSSSPGNVTHAVEEPDPAPILAGLSLSMPPLHTASLAHQPQAPDAMLDHQQQKLPAGVGPRPQSASYSSALPDGLLHQPTGAQPAASTHKHMIGGAAPHEVLPEAAQKLLPITAAACEEGLGDLPLAAAPDGDSPDGDSPDGDEAPARPASAFAPVAEEAPPTEWQAGAQVTEPQVHAGPEPVGAPLQDTQAASVTAPGDAADVQLPSKRQMRKLTRRKRTDSGMESHPLASADASLAQATGQDGNAAGADSTQLHLTPADGPSPDMQGTAVQACLDQAVANVTDAEPDGSRQEGVAVVPASDDEAEVQPDADVMPRSSAPLACSLVQSTGKACDADDQVPDPLGQMKSMFGVWSRIVRPSDAPELAWASSAEPSSAAPAPVANPSHTAEAAVSTGLDADPMADEASHSAADDAKMQPPVTDTAAGDDPTAAPSSVCTGLDGRGSYRQRRVCRPRKSFPTAADEFAVVEPAMQPAPTQRVTRAAAKQAELQAGHVLASGPPAPDAPIVTKPVVHIAPAQRMTRVAAKRAEGQAGQVPKAGLPAPDEPVAIETATRPVLAQRLTRAAAKQAEVRTGHVLRSGKVTASRPAATSMLPSGRDSAPQITRAARAAAAAQQADMSSQSASATLAAQQGHNDTVQQGVPAPAMLASGVMGRASRLEKAAAVPAAPEAVTSGTPTVKCRSGRPVKSAAEPSPNKPEAASVASGKSAVLSRPGRGKPTTAVPARANLEPADATPAPKTRAGTAKLQGTNAAPNIPAIEPISAGPKSAGARPGAATPDLEAATADHAAAASSKAAAQHAHLKQTAAAPCTIAQSTACIARGAVQSVRRCCRNRRCKACRAKAEADKQSAPADTPSSFSDAIPDDKVAATTAATNSSHQAQREAALTPQQHPKAGRDATPTPADPAANARSVPAASRAKSRTESTTPGASDRPRSTTRKRRREEDSDTEQLPMRPMPARIHQRGAQHDTAHQAPSRQDRPSACSPAGRGTKRAVDLGVSAPSAPAALTMSKSVARKRRKTSAGAAGADNRHRKAVDDDDDDVEILTEVHTKPETAMHLGGSIDKVSRGVRATPGGRGRAALPHQSQMASVHSLDMLIAAAAEVETGLAPEAECHERIAPLACDTNMLFNLQLLMTGMRLLAQASV